MNVIRIYNERQEDWVTVPATLPTLMPVQVIEQICAKLTDKPILPTPACTLIVGAGFSFGVVPLTRELLCHHIGNYYYEDSENNKERRGEDPVACRELSAEFWKELNAVVPREKRFRLSKGLPKDVSAAYQELFKFTGVNELFAKMGADSGKQFMRGFLRYIMNPGDTGRNRLNPAHRKLASLLQLQEDKDWPLRRFCRTIFTTNFDTLLHNSLDDVNVAYTVTDRPELGFGGFNFVQTEASAIHLVYTHGRIMRHNPANTVAEIGDLSGKNASALSGYLTCRDVLVLGYGGWNDTLMSALSACAAAKHHVYWFNRYPAATAGNNLDPAVVKLINGSGGRAVYVPLGNQGADGFMSDLYSALSATAIRVSP